MQYLPTEGFKTFIQSAVNARREGEENPSSSVVAETMNLLANSSYGYQIIDRSRHRVTKYPGVSVMKKQMEQFLTTQSNAWLI